MSNSMMNFTKGIVTGVVVGTTVGIALKSIKKPNPIKKNAVKAMRTMSAIMNTFPSMVK